MSNYNNDSYSYNHIIRGYEDIWPGKKEPPRKDSGLTPWFIVSVACLIYSIFNLIAILCS